MIFLYLFVARKRMDIIHLHVRSRDIQVQQGDYHLPQILDILLHQRDVFAGNERTFSSFFLTSNFLF